MRTWIAGVMMGLRDRLRGGAVVLLAVPLLTPGLLGSAVAKESEELISVQAVNAPLATVLRRLARQSAVPLLLYPEAKELVNVNVEGQALDTLLKGLLRDYNFVLHYHDVHAGGLSKIEVLSRKTPAPSVPGGLVPELKVSINQPLKGVLPRQAQGKALPLAGQQGRAGQRPGGPALGASRAAPGQAPGGDGRFVSLSRAAVAACNGVFISPTDQLESAPLTLDNRLGFFHADAAGGQHTGLKVAALASDSPLATLGLRAGDVVREINGSPVQSAADLTQQLQQTIGQGPAVPLILGVERPDGASDPAQPAATTSTPQHVYVRLVP